MSRTYFLFLVLGLEAAFCVSGCKKDDPQSNQPPLTFTSVEEINLTGENRLNSLVTIRWWGSDPDGVVPGYEFSFDQQEWIFTEEQDSTFLFSIDAGSDTVDIDFWVRAVDRFDLADPSPAYLKIPLKNTPPEIFLNKELIPVDTAFNVLTLTWDANDLDGFETLENIEMKINESDWVAISPGRTQVTIAPIDPEAQGATTAQLYFDESSTGPEIEGLEMNEVNNIYLRCVDIAGSLSETDTLESIYFRGKEHETLLIGAHSAQPNSFYTSRLNQTGVAFDFIDFVRDDATNQPPIWSPTFALLLKQYETVVIYSNDVTFTNKQTNAEDIVLEFAATSIQSYVQQGGKLMVSTSFPNVFSADSPLYGILPMDSLSTSDGLARLPLDSLAEGVVEGYPDLVCNQFITGLDPVYPSSDAMVLYTAQLTKNNWVGPESIGVRRELDGNTNFIFFSLELSRLEGDPAAVDQLFQKIFNDEFNW